MTQELEQRVTRLETDLDRLAQLQVQNQLQLNETNTRLHQLTMRVDAFVFEAQRLFARQGDMTERHDAGIDSVSQLVGRLAQNAEQDRTEARNTTQRMDSMISRLDALVDYLMRQSS